MQHRLHCLWLIFCLATLSLHSQSFAWPEGRHLTFDVQREIRTMDGMQSTWINLNNSTLSLDWAPISDWTLSINDNRAVSAQFVYRTVPSMKLQLIAYHKNAWINDMKGESIAAYIASLPLQFPNTEIQLTNEGQHKPPVGSVPFLGRAFRKIFYTVTPKESQKPPLTVSDFWTVTEGGHVVIARYSGTDLIVTRMNSSFERELAQFQLREN